MSKIEIKTDVPAAQLDTMPALIADMVDAMRAVTPGPITLTLDGVEAAWAAERLGIVGVLCVTLTVGEGA